MDFTSNKFPFISKYFDDNETNEAHQEPAGEDVKTNNVNYDHPLLSVTQLKHTLNFSRIFGNSDEKELKNDIKEKVLKDIVKASFKEKFPLEPLIYALDVKQKLDDRSSAGDAAGIISEMKGYAEQLKSTLGRQPLNAEMLMAYMLKSAGKVKTLLDKAKEKPYEKATPVGSKYDDIIFKKKRMEKKIIRKNKEVVQYFMKRMQTGNNVFPHLPFDQGNI